jgi:hypothetical protein
VEKLRAIGYCFAELYQVASIIGSSMRIKTRNLEGSLRSMATCAQNPMLDPGVHLGLFVVRARLDKFGFDVLVRKKARNLLPSMKLELPSERLEEWQIDLLDNLKGLPALDLMRELERASDRSPEEAQFASLFLNTLKDLRTWIDDPIFDEAKLIPKIVQAPCCPPAETSRPPACSIVPLHLVLPIHASIGASMCEFIPLELFKIHQMVCKYYPCHEAFERSVHRDMSLIFNSTPADFPSRPPNSQKWSMTSRKHRLAYPLSTEAAEGRISASREQLSKSTSNGSLSTLKPGSNLGQEEAPASSRPNRDGSLEKPVASPPHTSNFGGIMVSQEISIDVQEAIDVVGMSTEFPEAHTVSDRRTSVRRKNQGLAPVEEFELHGKLYGDRAKLQDSAIAIRNTGVFCSVTSNVDVKKDRDGATFVDELFAACMDER